MAMLRECLNAVRALHGEALPTPLSGHAAARGERCGWGGPQVSALAPARRSASPVRTSLRAGTPPFGRQAERH